MASGLATFLVVATVGVGGYALYRWWEEDKKKGDHWRRREAQNLKDAHVSGYFAGIQSGPAIVGAGEYDYTGYDYAGYYTGDAKPASQPPLDPRNCLCPMSLDPLDPTLPVYKCPCNVPGAVRPPYAGYMAVGRGGGGGHRRPPRQREQQQQDQGDQQQQGGGGDGGDMGGMGMPMGGPGQFGGPQSGGPQFGGPHAPGQFGGGHPGFGGGHPGFHPQHFGRR